MHVTFCWMERHTRCHHLEQISQQKNWLWSIWIRMPCHWQSLFVESTLEIYRGLISFHLCRGAPSVQKDWEELMFQGGMRIHPLKWIFCFKIHRISVFCMPNWVESLDVTWQFVWWFSTYDLFCMHPFYHFPSCCGMDVNSFWFPKSTDIP